MPTYDAWGRDVSTLKQCARCGQMIKNITYFEGNPYGPECIKVVTGQPLDYWVVRGGSIDKEATERREQKKREDAAKKRNVEERLAALSQERSARYSEMNKWLIDVLKQQRGGFCESMVRELSGWAVASLSDRQLTIIADIYAKSCGRRSSRKYELGYERVFRAYDDSEALHAEDMRLIKQAQQEG